MSRLYKIISISVILYINLMFGIESMAIVTKSIGGVDYRKHTEQTFLSKLDLGSELYNDDLIKTKSNGFVKFSYLDDGTTIKIHKNSEVYVRGDIDKATISKQINISNGVFNFDIAKQDNEEFTIITPTSVASVKGTKFILTTSSDGMDEFYGFEGIVEVLNIESNTTLRLSRNLKITSLPTGEINSEIMTQSDYNITNEIQQTEEQLDSEEIIPEDDDDSDSDSGTEDSNLDDDQAEADTAVNEVRIIVRNSDGEEKVIIVRYND